MYIRWMIRRDMEEVLAIERASFGAPWSDEDFVRALRQQATIGMVVEGREGEVAGYVIYWLQKRGIWLLNLAVHPQQRRRGLGRAIVDKLRTKLTAQRRRYLWADPSERNLAAHLFLAACGLRAICVVPGRYGGHRDAYRFVLDVGRESVCGGECRTQSREGAKAQKE